MMRIFIWWLVRRPGISADGCGGNEAAITWRGGGHRGTPGRVMPCHGQPKPKDRRRRARVPKRPSVGVAGSRVVTRRRHHRLARREQFRDRGELVAARLEPHDDAGQRAIGVPPATVGVEQDDRARLNIGEHLALDRSRRLGEGRVAG